MDRGNNRDLAVGARHVAEALVSMKGNVWAMSYLQIEICLHCSGIYKLNNQHWYDMNISLSGLMNFDMDMPSASEEVLMLDSYILEFDITNVRAVFL